MAFSSSVPRFLAPRLAHLPSPVLIRRTLPSIGSTSSARHASSSPSDPNKPRVLEKPAKFVPPSHGQRLRNATPKHYGRDLNAEEKALQKKKQYPHMMPPEGSTMYKFLTSKWLHVWISLSVLSSLAIFTISSDFKRTSPYADLLPSWGQFFSHPFAGMGQVFQVYKMHTEFKSQEAAERRAKRMEEVRKRKAYRVAHGIERADEGLQLERTVLEGVGVQVPEEEKPVEDGSPKTVS